jgi:hypothetical protein
MNILFFLRGVRLLLTSWLRPYSRPVPAYVKIRARERRRS